MPQKNKVKKGNQVIQVTDMLPTYESVIAETFPNVAHQYYIFHFIQMFNAFFKDSLKAHRTQTFESGKQKEAPKISFLLLKINPRRTSKSQ